jgi:ribokinase
MQRGYGYRVRTAVVGHTEWIEFGHVERVPDAGGIVHATDEWEEPGGGGAVAAVQLARLSGSCTFFTALGDDRIATMTRGGLSRLGVRVRSAVRAEPSRRAVTLVDAAGERTIITLGHRLEPRASDRLPWKELDQIDAVYFTAGDVEALLLSRRARVLVATSRAMRRLGEADLYLDAVVGSGRDPAERYDPDALSSPPGLVVRTNSSRGGTYETADGSSAEFAAVEPPGPIVDTYGSGDSFAAGLTFALGLGLRPEDALALAARCGAWCASGRGPYRRQLTASEL